MLRRALAAGLLVVVTACGSGERRAKLAQPPGGVGKIVFSIFEGLPAFNGNDVCSGLWAVNPDGSGLMRLTMPDAKDFESQYYPSFSPDGSLLAFEVLGEGGSEAYEIETKASVLDAASGDVRPVVTFTSSLFVNPRVVWSPKSDSVVIMRIAEDLTQIARVEIKGGDTKVLAEGDAAGAGSIAWAPDGSTIAYWTFSDDSIWLTDADGKDRRKLVSGSEPYWAPDSRRLAFFESADTSGSGEASLWLIGADGSGETPLVKGGVHQQRHHSVLWSPKGDRLIFLREAQDPVGSHIESDVYVLELEPPREKLRARAALPLAWSQDGEQILFAREHCCFSGEIAIGIYIGSADGTDERLVAVTDEEDINIGSYPVWQPTKNSVRPATGAIAPRKQYDYCVRQLERLRSSLRKRT